MFRPLFWSQDFSTLDVKKHKRTIIVQAMNYGTLDHWRWIKRHYGEAAVRDVLAHVPASEVRPKARRLATLMHLADSWDYAPRSSH